MRNDFFLLRVARAWGRLPRAVVKYSFWEAVEMLLRDMV